MDARADRSDRLLIFDLDGTLYDTSTSFVPTMRAIYAEYGVSYPSDDALLRFVGETFAVFLDWLIEQGFPEPRADLAERIAEAELVSIRERGALFPGVRETLTRLHRERHTIALCTNGDRRYADAVLSACGILDLFGALRTNDEGKTTKDRLVDDLVRRVPHTRAFVVGDRYHDIQAGRANGCTVIAAGYGYGRPEELEGADLRIERFPELLTVLG